VALFVKAPLYLALIPDGFSQDYFVEVDVVMDANTPLWKAHDISQQLQDKIEVLPNVGRAFVHVDHETTHAPVSVLTIKLVYLSPILHRSIGNTSNQSTFTHSRDNVTK
jgi:Dimerisation domain of Zinc Transporter